MIITVTFNPSLDKIMEAPNFAVGQTLKARTIRRQPAGKGVNVSRCIAALGGHSIATGFLGLPEMAAFEQSFLPAEATLNFVTVPGDTRQNITIRDPNEGTETHLREEGFTVGEEDVVALRDKLDTMLKPGDIVLFGGSLPAGMRAKHLVQFVGQCKAAGCSVALDTSGPALAEAVKAGCWMAKPNRTELEEMAGGTADSDSRVVKAAARLLRRVEILLVTLGEEGAWCFTKERRWKASVTVDHVQNTVGAGDAFLAGFIVSFTAGQPLDGCLRTAVACGAASTQQQWAGVIDPATVESLAKEVRIDQF